MSSVSSLFWASFPIQPEHGDATFGDVIVVSDNLVFSNEMYEWWPTLLEPMLLHVETDKPAFADHSGASPPRLSDQRGLTGWWSQLLGVDFGFRTKKASMLGRIVTSQINGTGSKPPRSSLPRGREMALSHWFEVYGSRAVNPFKSPLASLYPRTLRAA